MTHNICETFFDLKQNILFKSLMRWNKKPSNADHQFFFDLLALMLNYLPEKRLSAAYCRKHPFFSDLDPMSIQPRARSLNRSEPRKIRNSVRTTSQSSYFSSFSMTKWQSISSAKKVFKNRWYFTSLWKICSLIAKVYNSW